jgi:uncharacterized protein YutE (UPF0331/DUF86 family)
VGALERLLKLLLQYTALLDGLSEADLNDEYKYYSAVYLLQVQAQVVIDIVMRAASTLGYEVEGYADAGRKLMLAGVINGDEFSIYRSLVGFRNIAIHQYGSLNPNVIRGIISGRRYRDAAKVGVKVVDELRKRGIDC